MSVPHEEAHHLRRGLLYATTLARQTDRWVVVVCPVLGPETLKLFSCVAVEAARFSGRTAQFTGGGQVSLTESVTEVFVPPGEQFTVMFLGDGVNQGMEKWRKRAHEVVQVTV